MIKRPSYLSHQEQSENVIQKSDLMIKMQLDDIVKQAKMDRG